MRHEWFPPLRTSSPQGRCIFGNGFAFVVVFQDVEHVVDAEHPTVREHAVLVVDTRAVDAFRDRRVVYFCAVCILGANGHHIFCIPHVDFLFAVGDSFFVPIVRILFAVDDELAVLGLESDELIALYLFCDVAVADNVVPLINVELVCARFFVNFEADVNTLVAVCVNDVVVDTGLLAMLPAVPPLSTPSISTL